MRALSIHMTDCCNQSCKFCVVNSYQEKKEEVNQKLIFKFLEENAGKGYEMVNLHGGEPTILNEFIPVLEKIRDLGYPEVTLQTNAHTLSDRDFARKLVDLNVKTFVISYHTTRPRDMAWLSDVDEDWLSGIEQGIKNVKELGAKVRSNTVVYCQNVSYLDEIMNRLIDDLDVDHINISEMHPAGRAYENFTLVCPRLLDIMKPVKAAVDQVVLHGKKVTVEGFPPCLLGENYIRYIVDWENSNFKLLYHNFILPNYADFMSNNTRVCGQHCRACRYQKDRLCGGIYKEYVEKYGWKDFQNVSCISYPREVVQ